MRGGYSSWATLTIGLNASGDKVKQALEAWFYSANQEREDIEDVAMSGFEYIYCVRLFQNVTKMDLSVIDPFQYAYFLFYEYDELTGQLVIDD